MSFDIIAEPTVKSPKSAKPRRGRGFSREETSQAGLTIDDARKMGLIVDLRRKSVYPENIEALKQYMKDLEEIITALDKDEGVAGGRVATELHRRLGGLRVLADTLACYAVEARAAIRACGALEIAVHVI